MDSHADTCVVGDNPLIIHDHERKVSVTGYDHGKPKTFRIVDAVIGYEHPVTGDDIMVVINQAIHIPGLKHNLICPMQLRMNDVLVNEVPKFLCKKPDDTDHAILIPRTDDDRLCIPLSLEGVTSYFHSFKPTSEQYEAAAEGIDLLHLTDGDLEWDPHSSEFARQEEAMMGDDGSVREPYVKSKKSRAILRLAIDQEIMLDEFMESLNDNRFINNIRSIRPGTAMGRSSRWKCSVSALTSVSKPRLEPEALAKRWGIGLKAARETLKHTTQRAVRTVLHPSLSRRFRTNDRQLRYRRLPLTMFTDTLLTKVPSRRGNVYAQVFG